MKHAYLFIFSALLFLFMMCQPAVAQRWISGHERFDSISNFLEQCIRRGEAVSDHRQCVEELEAIARQEQKNQAVLQWRALFWKARMLQRHDPIEAEQLALQALANVDSALFRYDYMRIRSFILFEQIKAHQNAIAEYMERREQIAYALQIRDTTFLADALLGQGLLLEAIGDHARALDCLQQSSEYYSLAGCPVMAMRNKLNIANAYFGLSQKDTAIAILNDLLETPELQRDTFFITQLLATLNHIMPENPSDEYVRKAYRLSAEMHNPRLIAQSSVNMGAFWLMSKPDSAYQYYKQTWRYLETKDDFPLLFPTLRGLFASCMLTGRKDEAIMVASTFMHYNDSINQSRQALEISNMEQRRYIDQYEESLAQERELEKNQQLIFILVVTLLALAVGALGYILYLQRTKSQLKEKNKQLELEAKNRELTSHELKLIEQNRIFEELEKRISSARQQGDIDKQTAMELRSQINAHVKREGEWQNFHVQFEQVHPEFYTKLKTVAPSLTEGELRLCAYIRTGLDNKQIAAMLSQQPESIKKSRYRIRKKLPLTTEDSLEDFLRNL